MRFSFILIVFLLISETGFAQNKNTLFYDSLGQSTTWELHWSQVVTGRYRSVYNKKENNRTLFRTTDEEFAAELSKTEKRITETGKLGKPFPDFTLNDLEGNALSMASLKGKIVVVNFWFIGCGPCEMERPALNGLAHLYAGNPNVAFLSFARDTPEKLIPYLKEYPLNYRIIPTDKKFLASTFRVTSFPENTVLDREGRYVFYGSGTGIGIATILKREIDKALAH